MNFVRGFIILSDWKGGSYDIIFIIIDHFMKMVYYKLVKTMIDIISSVKVIIHVIIRYLDFLESIISD